MSSASSSTKSLPRDQYHHVIPRFILREFQLGPKKSKRERDEEYRKFRFVNERVWFYDIENGTLESTLIAGVYGVTNLYRDVRNAQDVDELEKKFSVLEATAARILHNLHRNLDRPQATLSILREELDQLRKFFFLMHYRSDALSLSYFSTTRPENAPIRARIQEMTLKLNFKSPAEVWLHFMRYYLDTPHSEIISQALKGMPTGNSPTDILKHLSPKSNAENFEAITYQSQAGMYYLGIVQAASGEEFILGHNTFGLWEGHITGIPGIHRLFIVSPQIAFILRLNFFRPDFNQSSMLRALSVSDLLDIQLDTPVTKALFNPDTTDIADFQKYRASDRAKRDQFTFRITQLSKQQTYAINSVVLLNTKPNGSLTFLSTDRMRSTVRKFWRDRDPASREERFKYEALIRRLSLTSAAITGEAVPSTGGRIRLPAPPVKSAVIKVNSPASPAMTSMTPLTRSASLKKTQPPLPIKPQASESMNAAMTGEAVPNTGGHIQQPAPPLKSTAIKADPSTSRATSSTAPLAKAGSSKTTQLSPPIKAAVSESTTKDPAETILDDAIGAQLLRLAGAPSPTEVHYQCMYSLWKLCANAPQELDSHPFVREYRRISQEAIRRFSSLLKPPPSSFKSRPNAELVGTLTSKDATAFFIFMDDFLANLGLNLTSENPADLKKLGHVWGVLLEDVTGFGLLLWIARNRHDFFDVAFNFRLIA